MNYTLHFYKNLNHNIRLEFLTQAPAFRPKEIGKVVQVASLDLQGQQDDIDTPIVKTSLSLSFVDASDVKNGKMNGTWDFFARATEKEWKVRIVRLSDNQILWSGYVTPDSYSEELRYRGTCSMIARDNIGQLQNYDFDAAGDADGMISFTDLVNTAWEKIDNGMQLVILPYQYWLQTAESSSVIDALMNVSAFEEKSWYEALESVLYSFGAVLRYRGDNTFVLCPLKHLPTMGLNTITAITPKMMTGASREFAPAVKSIEETADYDLEEGKEVALVTSQEFSGAVVNTEYEGKNVFGETIKAQTPVCPLTKTMYEVGWSNPVSNAPLLLNPLRYNRSDFVKTYLASDMLILTNTTGDNELVYTAEVNAESFKVKLSFGNIFQLVGNNLLLGSGELTGLTYSLSASQSGITTYWNGTAWVTGQTKLNAEFNERAVEIDCNLGAFSGSVTFRLHIFSIQRTDNISTESAGYVCLNTMEIAPQGQISLREVNRVNTRYDDANNVILTRNPQLASAFERTLYPSFIKNGIFQRVDGSILPTPNWIIYEDAESGEQSISQLSTGVHMQMLPYYTKPNSVISCTIVNADMAHFTPLFKWRDAECMLMSGSLDFLNGHIESAVLREFERYDKTWYGNGYLLTESGDLVVTSRDEKIIVKN